MEACGWGGEEDRQMPVHDSGPSPPAVLATNAFYYYADLDAAWAFYTRPLGFETVADYGFAKMLQVAPSSYLTLVDESRGMHSSAEPKSVTLAVVTEEVGAAEIVRRERAGIVVGGDPRDMAAAVSSLLADPRERSAMGERGKQSVREHYSWSSVARQMEDAYGEVVKGAVT